MIALWCGLAAAAPLAVTADAPVPTVITNVRILDDRGVVGPPRDVLLRDGLIDAILPVGDGWSADVVEVVDGTGGTLLPGLVDVHVHLGATTAVPRRVRLPSPRRNLAAFLFAGVTTVLDLSLPAADARRFSARIDAGRWHGPAVWTSGRPFSAPGGHPKASIRAVFPGPLVRLATMDVAWEVQTRDDVDAAFTHRERTGFVKIMLDRLPPGAPALSDEALTRLRTAATAFDERLIAHVGTPADLDRALALPVDALAHAPSHGAVSEAQAAALADAGIPVIPTLTVWDAFGGISAHDLPDWPLADAILPPSRRRDLARVEAGRNGLRGGMAEAGAAIATAADTRRDNVRRLHEAGVPILVGSDAPNLGLPAGSGTHHEIARLQDILPPGAVLAAATWGNSRFLDPDGRFGAVRPGWEADLLLVDGDPTRDPSALQAIRAVWTDGRRVTRNPRRARRRNASPRRSAGDHLDDGAASLVVAPLPDVPLDLPEDLEGQPRQLLP